ncbi:MAG: hypothetical protein A2W09_03780 [Deltaproteobacteria bacterium RBG_16_50_11]|nr:MAG: hypothetical protein A2W09_03780 [Deltaproteobacteria bacterium RBG_16_50_11]
MNHKLLNTPFLQFNLAPDSILLSKISKISAVQIRWEFLTSCLISLDFWMDIGLFQAQVHRRAAEIAEGYFFVIQS